MRKIRFLILIIGIALLLPVCVLAAGTEDKFDVLSNNFIIWQPDEKKDEFYWTCPFMISCNTENVSITGYYRIVLMDQDSQVLKTITKEGQSYNDMYFRVSSDEGTKAFTCRNSTTDYLTNDLVSKIAYFRIDFFDLEETQLSPGYNSNSRYTFLPTENVKVEIQDGRTPTIAGRFINIMDHGITADRVRIEYRIFNSNNELVHSGTGYGGLNDWFSGMLNPYAGMDFSFPCGLPNFCSAVGTDLHTEVTVKYELLDGEKGESSQSKNPNPIENEYGVLDVWGGNLYINAAPAYGYYLCDYSARIKNPTNQKRWGRATVILLDDRGYELTRFYSDFYHLAPGETGVLQTNVDASEIRIDEAVINKIDDYRVQLSDRIDDSFDRHTPLKITYTSFDGGVTIHLKNTTGKTLHTKNLLFSLLAYDRSDQLIYARTKKTPIDYTVKANDTFDFSLSVYIYTETTVLDKVWRYEAECIMIE